MSDSAVASVDLIPAVLLALKSDDVSPEVSKWTPLGEEDRLALGLSSTDFPNGLHLSVRAIVTDRLLDAVIDEATERMRDYGEFLPFSDSGVVLLVDGVVVAQPECCVDLSDGIEGWVRLVEQRPSSWEMVWTGHPWILARVVGDEVQFTEQTEESGTATEARFVVSFEQLALAVERGLDERRDFAEQLSNRLAERGMSNTEVIANRIAGISTP